MKERHRLFLKGAIKQAEEAFDRHDIFDGLGRVNPRMEVLFWVKAHCASEMVPVSIDEIATTMVDMLDERAKRFPG